jgi:hypothetical protein
MNRQNTIFGYTEEEIKAEIMAQEMHQEELTKYNEYLLEVEQARQEAYHERQEEFKTCMELDKLNRLKNFH